MKSKVPSPKSRVSKADAEINLSVKIGKLTLQNPVMVASGTFGYGPEYADLVDLSKLGAMVVKGISPEPCRS